MRHDNVIRREWHVEMDAQGIMRAADLMSFGLCVRGVINEVGKPEHAAEFWRRFTNVSDPITPGYVHASPDDAWLTRMLVSAGKRECRCLCHGSVRSMCRYDVEVS